MSFGLPYMPGAIWTLTSSYPWTRTFEDNVSDVISNQGTGTATISQDGTIYKNGSYSCKVIRTNTTGDRSGAHILLPSALDRSQTITVSSWAYHASGSSNALEIRLCNSSLQGYGFNTSGADLYGVVCGSRNGRDAYNSTSLTFSDNTWYRTEVIITSAGLQCKQYNSSNSYLGGTSLLSNTTYTSFDRILLCDYYQNATNYWDDLTVTLG